MTVSSKKPLNFNQLRKLRPGGLREVDPTAEDTAAEQAAPSLDHPSPPNPPKTTQAGLRPPKLDTRHAPARDFNRRANSLDRDALPAGIFPGASKKLYDALYLRTRGAIVPVKTIKATRRELGQWSGIKNIKTIAAHLGHLSTVGLVVHQWERGSTEGSVYEVRLPEEAIDTGLGWSKPTLAPLSTPETPLGQKTVLPLDQNSVLDGPSQMIDDVATSADAKTSFKTKDVNTDDEATRRFAGLLRNAELELTGKNSSFSNEWAELAELLIAELQIAAARTGQVSNVPAFLTEHLRRRLWKKDKAQFERERGQVPAEPALKVDASKCPDCGGAGWWYPDGQERGVAKCKHAKLAQ